MKFIGTIICLFLFIACTPVNSGSLVLRDSITGESLESSCSSSNKDDARKVFPSLNGKCDHIPKPSSLHRVTRFVINDEVCCLLQAYVDHGNGQITPIGD